jgi:hypothetical protein
LPPKVVYLLDEKLIAPRLTAAIGWAIRIDRGSIKVESLWKTSTSG